MATQLQKHSVQYPREKMGFRENGSFLANGTTFLTFYTSSKLEKWVFQKMGRLDDREENGTLTNLRESFVPLKTGVCNFGEENGFCNFENLHKLVCLKMSLLENGFCNF